MNWKGFFERIFFIHELNQDLIKEHEEGSLIMLNKESFKELTGQEPCL